MSKRRWFVAAAGAAALALVVAVAGAVVLLRPDDGPPGSAAPNALSAEFLRRDGDHLTLGGRPYAAAGANNYRPFFLDSTLVDAIMAAAAEHHLEVMRVWAFNDIGNADGSGSVDMFNTTTYFHY